MAIEVKHNHRKNINLACLNPEDAFLFDDGLNVVIAVQENYTTCFCFDDCTISELQHNTLVTPVSNLTVEYKE